MPMVADSQPQLNMQNNYCSLVTKIKIFFYDCHLNKTIISFKLIFLFRYVFNVVVVVLINIFIVIPPYVVVVVAVS